MDAVITIIIGLMFLGLFACMIIAVAMHMWFAAAGWFVAWIFSCVVGIIVANS